MLRTDDRGVGKSTGDFTTATTAGFATDAEAGFAHLKRRAEVDPRKVGLIGHSEGALIAAMIAARNQDVAFIIMMAGTGVPGDQVLPAQVAAILEANGKRREEVEKAANEERDVLALAEAETDEATLQKSCGRYKAAKVPRLNWPGRSSSFVRAGFSIS